MDDSQHWVLSDGDLDDPPAITADQVYTVSDISKYDKTLIVETQLIHNGGVGWDLVEDYTLYADHYGCAFVETYGGEVINIWCCISYVPFLWNRVYREYPLEITDES